MRLKSNSGLLYPTKARRFYISSHHSSTLQFQLLCPQTSIIAFCLDYEYYIIFGRHQLRKSEHNNSEENSWSCWPPKFQVLYDSVCCDAWAIFIRNFFECAGFDIIDWNQFIINSWNHLEWQKYSYSSDDQIHSVPNVSAVRNSCSHGMTHKRWVSMSEWLNSVYFFLYFCDLPMTCCRNAQIEFRPIGFVFFSSAMWSVITTSPSDMNVTVIVSIQSFAIFFITHFRVLFSYIFLSSIDTA